MIYTDIHADGGEPERIEIFKTQNADHVSRECSPHIPKNVNESIA